MDRDETELKKELEAVLAQPKEKRLEFYFRYRCNLYAEDLGLTEEDVREYQKRKEDEVSMKPTEKRDILVKQIIKPLLKERGFKTSGHSWWKELDDSWLFVYMKNSSWNSVATGVSFGFKISVSGKDEIRGKLSEQWIYNQLSSLCQNDFLPYNGWLSPRMKVKEYKIDGYRDHLPVDDPLEEILEQIKGDFVNHILPVLDGIRTKADWETLYREKRAVEDKADIRLLRYYSVANMYACSESNMSGLIRTQQNFALTKEQIISHFDWLEIIKQKSEFTYFDTKTYILKTLEMQED